jgi:two-component system, NtrC family, sensor kinase
MAGAIFIPVTYLQHILILLGDKKDRIIRYGYLAGIIFLIFDLTPYYIPSVSHKLTFMFWPDPGILFHPFLFIWGLFVAYGTILIAAGYLYSKENNKNLMGYILLATIIGWSGGATNYLLWYDIPIPPYGNILVSVYVAIIAYAILRHRLMDIEVVIKKTAGYSLLTAMITGIFLSVIVVSDYFVRLVMGTSSVWVGIVAAFVVALVFQPLRDLIQKGIDKIFFRTRYEYQSIINKYSHALARPMADLDRFARIAPYLLWKSMKLSGSSVLILDRVTKKYVLRAGEGTAKPLIGQTLPEDSALIQELTQNNKEIDREELNYRLRSDKALTEQQKAWYGRILAELDEIKAALVIPNISESEYFNKPTLLALLCLGAKMSEEQFSREDIDFLETLGNQATISIEYAFILEELKKNQEQVIKSEKLATLGTTTAGIAHELKNPLTYLQTIAQVMESAWDNKAFKESVIKMLPSEVERMKLIIEGLSDFSKQHELRLDPTEMTAVLDKTLAVLAYDIRKSNVFIKKNYPAENEEKAVAIADKYRIVQVFMNIIANAVQAMGKKGGDLSITVRQDEKEVKISIMDTGPGIPPENLKTIFDPFFTTKESGTGLGLSITKRIVDEHHGSIYVASHVGEGTTFTICLPRA